MKKRMLGSRPPVTGRPETQGQTGPPESGQNHLLSGVREGGEKEIPTPTDRLIQVSRLTKHYRKGFYRQQIVRAVDGVSFDIASGETFGLAGESGCGKSTLAACLLRLTEPSSGQIFFRGTDINSPEIKLKQLRKKVQIIFQDADGALNPRMKTRDLLLEPLRIHGLIQDSGQHQAEELLALVNLSPELLNRRPFQLSGGQRQRIGIARAVSLAPELIVADEAAASLDQLVGSQIIALLKKLRAEKGISYLFISHDLDLIHRLAHRLAIMYLGRFVEVGGVDEIFDQPAHPYTKALLCSRLKLDTRDPAPRVPLQGERPGLLAGPTGCVFNSRCPEARTICREVDPGLKIIGPNHQVACHMASQT